MTWRDFITVVRRSLIRRPQDDRDLDDEIRFHLAQETQLLTDRGNERRTRVKQPGERLAVSLSPKSTRGAVWISTTIEQFVQDVRFGWRIFQSAPGLSATAVLLIALVIGGNTTVFSIAHGILAKPAPGVTAPRLVTLSWIDDKGRVEPFNSYVAYDSFQRSTKLERVLAWDMDRATLNHENGSYAIQRAFVSPNYFETLGARFERGRSFAETEAATGTYGLMIVISHNTWVSYFQHQEDIIGRAVMLNDQPATIIGVAAAPFRGTVFVPPADVWVPLSALSGTQTAGRPHDSRLDMGVFMIGVLRRAYRSLRPMPNCRLCGRRLRQPIPISRRT